MARGRPAWITPGSAGSPVRLRLHCHAVVVAADAERQHARRQGAGAQAPQIAPATNSSKRSTRPGLLRCGLASGEISAGWSSTNVGCCSRASTTCASRPAPVQAASARALLTLTLTAYLSPATATPRLYALRPQRVRLRRAPPSLSGALAPAKHPRAYTARQHENHAPDALKQRLQWRPHPAYQGGDSSCGARAQRPPHTPPALALTPARPQTPSTGRQPKEKPRSSGSRCARLLEAGVQRGAHGARRAGRRRRALRRARRAQRLGRGRGRGCGVVAECAEVHAWPANGAALT